MSRIRHGTLYVTCVWEDDDGVVNNSHTKINIITTLVTPY